jgi:hypothetical protein
MIVPKSLVNLEISNFDQELEAFVHHMKQVLDVLNLVLSFLHAFEKKKGHNIFALMLDPIFTSMHLMNTISVIRIQQFSLPHMMNKCCCLC